MTLIYHSHPFGLGYDELVYDSPTPENVKERVTLDSATDDEKELLKHLTQDLDYIDIDKLISFELFQRITYPNSYIIEYRYILATYDESAPDNEQSCSFTFKLVRIEDDYHYFEVERYTYYCTMSWQLRIAI